MSHDELERRLGAWMAEVSPSRAPVGLVERAMVETDRVRQRPARAALLGLIAGRFARPVSEPGPRPMVVLLLLLLLLLTAAAFIAGARLLSAEVVEETGLGYVFNGDVYVAEADGTNAVRILDGDLNAACGGYIGFGGVASPDGRHIAVRTAWDDACDGSIVISDAQGRVVATVPGVGWDIAWSPDGDRFATWLGWEPEPRIGVYGLDGKLLAEVGASIVCCGDYDPRWAPDGTALLVPAGYGGVARLPLDGADPEVLQADDALSHRSASAAPDGTRVAYVDGDGSLKVSAADGSQSRVLLDPRSAGPVDGSWQGSPVWSAGSDRIAVSAGGELLVVEPVSAAATTVNSGLDGLRPIAFSTDGEHILAAHDHDGESVWLSVAIDGSGSTALTVGAEAAGWLSHSPGEPT